MNIIYLVFIKWKEKTGKKYTKTEIFYSLDDANKYKKQMEDSLKDKIYAMRSKIIREFIGC